VNDDLIAFRRELAFTWHSLGRNIPAPGPDRRVGQKANEAPMARRTKVVVVCDLHRTETPATGSVEIAIDGERRTLDLCAEHLAEVRKAMRPWLRQGTPGAATTRPAAARGKAATSGAKKRPFRNPDAPEVRAWALANGFDIPARGRIPSAVREAYQAR
jgi:hypothetical protein